MGIKSMIKLTTTLYVKKWNGINSIQSIIGYN